MILDERTRRRLAVVTRFDDIREFDTIGSTNRWLLDQAGAGAPEGVVAVADHQSAGRGRLDRVWEAPPGTSLLASLLFRPAGLAPGRLHLVTSAVGLAARAACAGVGGFTPELKWPNDLLFGGAKLAGVLAEAAGGAVVVGIGLNVGWAPPGAISADAAAGRHVDRAGLLVAFLEGVEGWYGRWDDVARAYRAACGTIGRTVSISLPRSESPSGRASRSEGRSGRASRSEGRSGRASRSEGRSGPGRSGGDLVGVAEGIDDDGCLLVRPPGGPLEVVAAGDVVHVRLVSPP